jgi:pimeloyl-ACP methyl ester carboxylesterase
MPSLAHRGSTIHYACLGEGPDVVLLHGLTGSLGAWHPRIVAELSADYRLTLVDLPGHGRSGLRPAGYTTRDIAADIAALLDHLAIERACLAGHSYGGAVALHFGLVHPGRTTALVLADTRVRALQPGPAVGEWTHRETVRTRLATYGITLDEDGPASEFRVFEELAQRKVDVGLDDLKDEPFFVPFAAGDDRAARRWLRLMRETTARRDFCEVAGLVPDAIRTIAAPTLAVYGSLSHCLGSQHALAALMPDCAVAVVEGAGHFHPLVKPRAFLDHMRTFLGGLDLPAFPLTAGGAPRAVARADDR